MKADVNAYLKVLYDASPAAVGGKLPDANFYYTKATPGQVFWRSVQRSSSKVVKRRAVQPHGSF